MFCSKEQATDAEMIIIHKIWGKIKRKIKIVPIRVKDDQELKSNTQIHRYCRACRWRKLIEQ